MSTLTRTAWGLDAVGEGWRHRAACSPKTADWFVIAARRGLSADNERALALCETCPVLAVRGGQPAAVPTGRGRGRVETAATRATRQEGSDVRILDLFCGAGGAAVGYARAGFDVVGVDHVPQPRYPYEFVRADALTWLADADLTRFDAIHASPPCQAYSVAGHHQRAAGKLYPDLIAPTRELLAATGLPWVIENVPGAPVRPDFRLCGCQFGLAELRRVRWFETSWQGYALDPPCRHTEPAISVAGHGEPSRTTRRRLGLPNATVADWRRAMGVDWMTRDELAQAIPPAYTQHVGEWLAEHIRRQVTACPG